MKWFERNPQRLENEVMLIKRNHPSARIFFKGGKVMIFLKVISRKNDYLAKIIYPEDFPFEQPKAFILEQRLRGNYHKTHRYSDSSLCLATPDQVGPQTSGKVICDWVNGWVKGYEIWKRTKEFPEGY